jgi:hypothetical protein
MSSRESFMGHARRAVFGALRSQLSGGKREQQWYARPAKLVLGAKPCSFNTIGGVADTRLAFETRTKEQGLGDVAAPSDEARRLRNHPEASGASPRTTGMQKDALCRRWRVC